MFHYGLKSMYHPDKEAANHAIILFNDKAEFHFRQVLKHRHGVGEACMEEGKEGNGGYL